MSKRSRFTSTSTSAVDRRPPTCSAPNTAKSKSARPSETNLQRPDGRGRSAASRANLRRGGQPPPVRQSGVPENLNDTTLWTVPVLPSTRPAISSVAVPSLALQAEIALESWERLANEVESKNALCLPLGKNLWLVQGWDTAKACVNDVHWSHLQSFGGPNSMRCDCSSTGVTMDTTECIHRLLFKNRRDLFLDVQTAPPEALIIALDRAGYRFLYSVGDGQSQSNSGKRRICGLLANGSWRCTCNKTTLQCKHIPRVKSDAMRLDLLHPNGVSREGSNLLDSDLLDSQHDAIELRTRISEAVSHRPRGPALCFRLDRNVNGTELLVPPTSTSQSNLPEVLRLDCFARCSCGYVPPQPISPSPTQSPFTIYCINQVIQRTIETVQCPSCRYRSIGPDLNDIGLFNWNNKFGFDRAVFDTYESHCSKVTYPIKTFHRFMVDNYINSKCEDAFISASTFLRCAFAFRRLHKLDSGMCCPSCGPNPDIVIVDGKAAGFSSQFVTDKLTPPTVITEQSEVRTGIYPFSKFGGVRFIEPTFLALAPRRHLKKPSDAPATKTMAKDFLKPLREWISQQSAALAMETTQAFEDAIALLDLENGHANHGYSDTIKKFIEYTRDFKAGTARMELCSLLKLVVSGDASFQIVPPLVFEDMRMLLRGGQPSPRLCSNFPVLAKVLEEFCWGTRDIPFPSPILNLLEAMLHRSQNSFSALVAQHSVVQTPVVGQENHLDIDISTNPSISLPSASAIDQISWRESGSCFGSPKIRSRPRYPGIKNDGGAEKSPSTKIESEQCGKYYSTYSKAALTGGIVGFWCPHGVCVGFHFLPKGEGRNDVFSGIYCHWKIAPKVIIYDFACALAPYCLLREPQYFKDTRFYIDELHAHGHTTCSQACFLAPAMCYDPRLQDVNSSVAEGAHNFISRIERSLSYMNEQNAILTMWTIIQIWNRQKLRDKFPTQNLQKKWLRSA